MGRTVIICRTRVAGLSTKQKQQTAMLTEIQCAESGSIGWLLANYSFKPQLPMPCLAICCLILGSSTLLHLSCASAHPFIAQPCSARLLILIPCADRASLPLTTGLYSAAAYPWPPITGEAFLQLGRKEAFCPASTTARPCASSCLCPAAGEDARKAKHRLRHHTQGGFASDG